MVAFYLPPTRRLCVKVFRVQLPYGRRSAQHHNSRTPRLNVRACAALRTPIRGSAGDWSSGRLWRLGTPSRDQVAQFVWERPVENATERHIDRIPAPELPKHDNRSWDNAWCLLRRWWNYTTELRWVRGLRPKCDCTARESRHRVLRPDIFR